MQVTPHDVNLQSRKAASSCRKRGLLSAAIAIYRSLVKWTYVHSCNIDSADRSTLSICNLRQLVNVFHFNSATTH